MTTLTRLSASKSLRRRRFNPLPHRNAWGGKPGTGS